ncbi:MAG: proton-conducting transporter membrane subunit [Thermoanaerobaculia bacterium]|nr:proton-conducting transporter membrane subunit [Thermoanaerobaculia bacterium]
MSSLPVLAFALPALLGLLLWLLRAPARTAWWTSLGGAAGFVALAAAMIARAAEGRLLVHAFGGWRPPFGIVLVVDRLAALFVLLLAVSFFWAVVALAPGRVGETVSRRALPVLWLLVAGLVGAFQTGDLFNLFVMFELVLLASYLLLQVPGGLRALGAALPNLLANLLASLLFLVGAGLLYGATGTLSLADLAGRIGSVPAGTRTAVLTLLVVAFGVKAGLVPVLFWLPATYPTLSGPVAALFAGMMTKLGVYALLRIAPILLPGTALPGWLVAAGAVAALLGVLGALAQYEVRRLLGFHIVSQVGYMVLGLGLLTPAGLAGAVLYLSHHILVKGALYLVADELERRHGTRDLRGMGAGAPPLLAAAFGVAAASLAGLPPFSGFFAKVGLFLATVDARDWASLAVLGVASLLTLASMLKIWQLAFRGGGGEAGRGGRWPLAPAGLAACSLALALAAAPAWEYARATAAQLLDVESYRARVLAAPGLGSEDLPDEEGEP